MADVAVKATKGVWAFKMRITPEGRKLTNGSDEFALRPNMTASVDITTDKRRLISYFFAPIVDAVLSAISER